MNADEIAQRLLLKLDHEYAVQYAAEQLPIEICELIPDVVAAIERLGKDPVVIFNEIIRRADDTRRS